jgi:hypothetical protein
VKILLVLLILCSLCIAKAYPDDYDPDDVNPFSNNILFFGANSTLFDEQGNILPGNAGLGIPGAVIQLIKHNGDGTIKPPDSEGNPAPEDTHLFYIPIGRGIAGFLGEIGMFSVNCNYTSPSDRIYARIFNAVNIADATYYGQTELRTISSLYGVPNSSIRYFIVDNHGLLNTNIPLDPQGDVGAKAHAGGPYVGAEGSPILLDAAGTIDPDTDISDLVFTWDLDGDRQFDDATGITLNYAWPDNCNNVVRVRAMNPLTGVSGIAVTQTTISNAPPSISPVGDFDMSPGKQLVVSTTYFDPGINDTHTISINWGDTTMQNGVPVSGGIIQAVHSYTAEGIYPVQITIYDDDGASASTSFQVKIAVVPVPVQASLSVGNGITINWQAKAGNYYEIWFTDEEISPFDENDSRWHLLDIVTTSPYVDTGNLEGYDNVIGTADDRLSPDDVDRRFYTILELPD